MQWSGCVFIQKLYCPFSLCLTCLKYISLPLKFLSGGSRRADACHQLLPLRVPRFGDWTLRAPFTLKPTKSQDVGVTGEYLCGPHCHRHHVICLYHCQRLGGVRFESGISRSLEKLYHWWLW